jgi:hypothetical protein
MKMIMNDPDVDLVIIVILMVIVIMIIKQRRKQVKILNKFIII